MADRAVLEVSATSRYDSFVRLVRPDKRNVISLCVTRDLPPTLAELFGSEAADAVESEAEYHAVLFS